MISSNNNNKFIEPNTLTIHLDENSFRTIQIELTPDYNCEQFLKNYAQDLDNSCLIESWRGHDTKKISLSNIMKLNMENNNNNTQSSSSSSQKIVDLTLYELQEIAMKQQQQIEINQQLLLAKEKRLKQLKQDELKHLNNNNNQPLPQQQQQQQKYQQKDNNLSHEYKLLKLKQLRNQIIEQKISNSNMNSEIDLIKSLFATKERELFDAISKVSELTKQIEQLKFIKQQNKLQINDLNTNSNEFEKLKQELHIRNKLNEQQAKKIMHQQDLFRQKQLEVETLDKRIDDLQKRIAAKRELSNRSVQFNSLQRQLNNKNNFDTQQSPQQLSPSNMLFEDDIDGNFNNNTRLSTHTKVLDPNIVCSNNSSESPVSFESAISPSPSKVIPKFATKQEIAHTYMNKYGSEAYQKYQEASKRLQQPSSTQSSTMTNSIQQQQQQPQSIQKLLPINVAHITNTNQHLKQISIDSNDSLSSNSASSPSTLKTTTNGSLNTQQQQQQQQVTSSSTLDTSSLPSHLKIEFDKIKFIPDMVKTIKKRHSISEIEGSMHTVAPQVFQKMLEQHHKNSQQKSLNVIKENESSSQSQISPPLQQQQQQQQQRQQRQQNNDDTMILSDNTDKLLNEQDIKFKKAKPIIKMPSLQRIPHNRRVNFDPHALLLDAAVEGELDLVKKCSKNVKSISEPNDEGITALHNSVCAGHFDIVKFLVESGCDINYADNDGWTPLHCAASCNNLQMVKFLIEHGAAVFATTISDNETAIDKCEEDEEGYEGCFEYLKNIQEKLGTVNNNIVYALYDYEPENDDELKFKCTDQLIIINKNNEQNDGWWSAKLGNIEGQVPRNYLGLYPRVKSSKFESTVC